MTTLSNRIVEAMARAMWALGTPPFDWDMAPDTVKNIYRDHARAALTAGQQAWEAEGVVLVRVPEKQTTLSPLGANWVDGHNAAINATLAGRVWP